MKRMDAVIYIDADCRILYKTYKNTASDFSLIVSPGFHRSWDWGLINRPDNKFFTSGDVADRVAGYGELALSLCKSLNIDYTKAFHYQEGIIAIAKDDGKEQIFLDIWKKLASKLDAHDVKNKAKRIGVGEGNLVGLALAKSDMTINSTDVCNTIGEHVKYNFYGRHVEKIMETYPDRKVVATSGLKEIINKIEMVEFKEKKVKLEFSVNEVDDATNMVVFKWNHNNAVEFLDHEFKVNDRVFHFESDKTNEFYFKKTDPLEIFHTYDWYGEKNWTKIT